MRIELKNPQIDNTEDGINVRQVRRNRHLFNLALLVTTALLATAFWVSNTQTPAHVATEELALAAPTAPYCPPGSDGPSDGDDGDYPSGDSSGDETHHPNYPASGDADYPSDGSGGEEVDNPDDDRGKEQHLEDPGNEGYPSDSDDSDDGQLPTEFTDEDVPEEGPLGPDGRPGPLNDKDRLAIWRYTINSQPMNNALLTQNPRALRRHADAISSLSSALRKLPDFKGKVYRTTKLSLAIFRGYNPGDIITHRRFTSSSKDIDLEYGPVGIVINSKTGKDITQYSRFDYEEEVLFMPGTSFRVESKYRDPQSGQWMIVMSEV